MNPEFTSLGLVSSSCTPARVLCVPQVNSFRAHRPSAASKEPANTLTSLSSISAFNQPSPLLSRQPAMDTTTIPPPPSPATASSTAPSLKALGKRPISEIDPPQPPAPVVKAREKRVTRSSLGGNGLGRSGGTGTGGLGNDGQSNLDSNGQSRISLFRTLPTPN